MIALLIPLILILGYHYSSSVEYEKVKLKRSSGWEAYTYLAKHGLNFVWLGFKTLLIVSLVILSVVLLYLVLNFLISKDISNELRIIYKLSLALMSIKDFNENYTFMATLIKYFLYISLIVFSWSECLFAIQRDKKRKLENELKKEDSFLNLILEALPKQHVVRLSLKSRKVYIGYIQSEQFDRLDLENVVIIPYLSGYRNKDDLKISLTHNYSKVYEENNIVPSNKDLTLKDIKKLDFYRIVINLKEIESIALHDPNLYEEFR